MTHVDASPLKTEHDSRLRRRGLDMVAPSGGDAEKGHGQQADSEPPDERGLSQAIKDNTDSPRPCQQDGPLIRGDENGTTSAIFLPKPSIPVESGEKQQINPR